MGESEIAARKAGILLSELCKGFPSDFKEYLTYTRKLDFKTKPDYQMLKRKFKALREQREYKCEDHDLPWLVEQTIYMKDLVAIDRTRIIRQPDESEYEFESTAI